MFLKVSTKCPRCKSTHSKQIESLWPTLTSVRQCRECGQTFAPPASWPIARLALLFGLVAAPGLLVLGRYLFAEFYSPKGLEAAMAWSIRILCWLASAYSMQVIVMAVKNLRTLTIES